MPDRFDGGSLTRDLTRRTFVFAALGGVGMTLRPEMRGSRNPAAPRAAGQTVLFQGDSITDCGRDRSVTDPNKADALGTGYPLLIAAALLEADPAGGLQFFNRGVSGNTVPDLQGRWDADTIALKPDLISILIGVNDLWHRLDGNFNGTVADYESGYGALLDSTRRALPAARLVVLEPFVLRCGVVNARWFPEFDERRAAAARIARSTNSTFVPLQAMFDQLAERSEPVYWAADGVHPTPAGHAAIAELWRKMVDLDGGVSPAR